MSCILKTFVKELIEIYLWYLSYFTGSRVKVIIIFLLPFLAWLRQKDANG